MPMTILLCANDVSRYPRLWPNSPFFARTLYNTCTSYYIFCRILYLPRSPPPHRNTDTSIKDALVLYTQCMDFRALFARGRRKLISALLCTRRINQPEQTGLQRWTIFRRRISKKPIEYIIIDGLHRLFSSFRLLLIGSNNTGYIMVTTRYCTQTYAVQSWKNGTSSDSRILYVEINIFVEIGRFAVVINVYRIWIMTISIDNVVSNETIIPAYIVIIWFRKQGKSSWIRDTAF